MAAEDLNDVRQALGAIQNAVRALGEKVEAQGERLDDITALAARSAALGELLDDLETMLGAVPDGLRAVGKDPTFGPFVAPQLNELADTIEAAVRERRNRRASAPGIERG